MINIKFIDFFSGAGMFRKGMELAGHKCIGYVEIDKFARKTYETNYNITNEWTSWDINKVPSLTIPSSDIWCFGFPCKNMSVANSISRTGLQGAQSGLFVKMCDLLSQISVKPTYLFIENVKGFTTIHGGKDFLWALCRLHSLGYDIKYEVSSALNYNVPQNRIRTYLVCQFNKNLLLEKGNDIPNKKYINISGINIQKLYEYSINKDIKINFNKSGNIHNGICLSNSNNIHNNKTLITLKDILEDNVDTSLYLNEQQINKIKIMKGAKTKILKDGRIWKEGSVPFPDDIYKNARCITPSDGSLNRSTHIIYDKKGYRKLSIRERARLQGLPDDFIFPVSNSQASLQLGNGVVVNVIKEIAKREMKLISD